MTDTNRDAGDPGRWEPAALAKRRQGGAVISVRIPPELAKQVDAISRAHDMSLSETVRIALDNFVNSGLSGSVSYGITGTVSFDGSLRLTGPTVQIRSMTHSEARQQEIPFAFVDR